MKKRKYLIIAVFLAAAAVTFLINGQMNKRVILTSYTVSSEKIPENFDRYKILVISDLHNADFVSQIVEIAEKAEPDIVVFTGDMVQLPDDCADSACEIAEALSEKAEIYGVSGNHETDNYGYYDIIERLEYNKVKMLENDSVILEKNGDKICLAGLKDPKHKIVSEGKYEKIYRKLEGIMPKEEMFTVLLNHRASMYPRLKNCGADLILSGHLHGGIIRLLFVGGVIDENRGFFPKYDYGRFEEDDGAVMIVSGGCDKNPEKPRFFNPPEVVLVTLEAERENDE